MFTKLLKHDIKSCAPLLGILSACLVGAAILAGLDIRFILSNTTSPETLNVPGYIFIAFAYLGFIAYLIACFFVPLSRFYKSRFTDEGYLTFTLPVKTSQIFLSSALNMMFWQIVEILVIAVSISILLLIAVPATEFEAMLQAFRELPLVLDEIFDGTVWASYLIILPVTWISGVVIPMTAVVIGAITAKKHKILAAIGIYYGITVLSSILSSAATASLTINTYLSAGDLTQYIISSAIATAIVPALLSVCGYLLSIHLMKNKLNLP